MGDVAVNDTLQLLASGANPAAGNSGDLDNPDCRGVVVVVDITAFTSGSITVIIEGKDPVSGKYYTLLSSAALAAAATTTLTVYPGAVVTANVSANANLPRIYRVRWTVSSPVLTVSIGSNRLV